MTGINKAFLDVSALFEETWTGIPNMVAAIAARAMVDTAVPWTFTYETLPLPHSLVERFIQQRGGAGGLAELSRLAWETPTISEIEARSAIALFPNIKAVRRYFAREAIIVSDLSPVIAAEFHNSDNITHFANRIHHDIASSDHIFCISKATMTDVHAYFGKPLEQMSIIRLGAEFDPVDLAAGMLSSWGDRAEPYVVIVGTLEPRKNGTIVFDYLTQNPGFVSKYSVVFIGRDGWLAEKTRLMARAERSGVDPTKIVFTGYVTEAEKLALMLNSAFCVYPSLFEGFGLPVLEAAALGKTTVCSNSSSMPEVAPDSCVFFDPMDLAQFARAMQTADQRAAQSRSASQSLPDLIARSEPYGWDDCYASIAAWAKEQMS